MYFNTMFHGSMNSIFQWKFLALIHGPNRLWVLIRTAWLMIIYVLRSKSTKEECIPFKPSRFLYKVVFKGCSLHGLVNAIDSFITVRKFNLISLSITSKLLWWHASPLPRLMTTCKYCPNIESLCCGYCLYQFPNELRFIIKNYTKLVFYQQTSVDLH